MNKIKFFVTCLTLFFAGVANAQTLTAKNLNLSTDAKEGTLEISFTSSALPASCQFDLVLPTGLSLKTNSKGKVTGTKKGGAFVEDPSDSEDTHTIQITAKDGGVYTFLCYDPDGGEFFATSGVLATVQVVAADDLTDGEYECSLKNAKFVNKAAETLFTQESGSFKVGFNKDVTTGISRLTLDDPNAEVYTLSGQRIDGKSAKKGVYVVNGKKVAVK